MSRDSNPTTSRTRCGWPPQLAAMSVRLSECGTNAASLITAGADNPKKAVDVAAAFEVWEEMRKNKVRPTLRGYNELLKICNEGTSQDRKIALEVPLPLLDFVLYSVG